jgi:hypothetical protein
MSSIPPAAIVAVEHVFKSVTDSAGTLDILQDIDFTLGERETAAIAAARNPRIARPPARSPATRAATEVSMLPSPRVGNTACPNACTTRPSASTTRIAVQMACGLVAGKGAFDDASLMNGGEASTVPCAYDALAWPAPPGSPFVMCWCASGARRRPSIASA